MSQAKPKFGHVCERTNDGNGPKVKSELEKTRNSKTQGRQEMSKIEELKDAIGRTRRRMTKYWWPSIGVIRLLLPEAEALLAEIDALQDELTDRKKQVEAAFEILEKYTPAEKLQEAGKEGKHETD